MTSVRLLSTQLSRSLCISRTSCQQACGLTNNFRSPLSTLSSSCLTVSDAKRNRISCHPGHASLLTKSIQQPSRRSFSSDDTPINVDNKAVKKVPIEELEDSDSDDIPFGSEDGDNIPLASDTPLDDTPLAYDDVKRMTNEQLQDTSTIPGWELIHSPPRKFPRGALIGMIVSTKMQRTVNVAVERYRIVPKLRVRRRYTRKFFAHDQEEVGNTGDLVMIVPCQRLSKRKHFLLREIIRPKGQL